MIITPAEMVHADILTKVIAFAVAVNSIQLARQRSSKPFALARVC